MADPWVVVHALGARWRPVHWVAKAQLYTTETARARFAPDKPYLWGWLIGFFLSQIVKHSLTIPVEPGSCRQHKQTARSIAHVLASGGIVGIFPEGGISKPKMTRTFLSLARRHRVPILPVRIDHEKHCVIIGMPIQVCQGSEEEHAATLAAFWQT